MTTVAMPPASTDPRAAQTHEAASDVAARTASNEASTPLVTQHTSDSSSAPTVVQDWRSSQTHARAKKRGRAPLLFGGLAALLLVGVVGAVFVFTVFRKSDSDNHTQTGTAGGGSVLVAPVPPGQGSDASSANPTAGAGGALTLAHEKEVHGVAFSPDGKILASGGDEQTVRLWDAQTGRLRETSQDLGGSARPFAFSPDGRTLAVALYATGDSNSCAVVLFDTQGGRLGAERRRIQVPNCPLNFAALSSDGRTLATATNEVRLWDVETGELKHTLEGHSIITESVAFSPDGSMLASAGHVDGAVRLWDVRAGKLRQEIKAHDAPTAVAFSPDGRTLATGGYDGTLKLWDVGGGAPKRSLDYAPNAIISSIVFSPDGRLVACGGDGPEGELKVWDARTGELKMDLKAGGVVNSVAFSPDGKGLACATSDKAVKLWNVKLP